MAACVSCERVTLLVLSSANEDKTAKGHPRWMPFVFDVLVEPRGIEPLTS